MMSERKAKQAECSTITVEDLLRVKRQEVPKGEFWDGFDRDLQKRQLRVLVSSEKSRNGLNWKWIIPALGGIPVAALLVFSVTFQSLSFDPLNALETGLRTAVDELPAHTEPVAQVAVGTAPDVDVSQGWISMAPRVSGSNPIDGEARFAWDAFDASQDNDFGFTKVHSTVKFATERNSSAIYVANAFAGQTALTPQTANANQPSQF